MAAPSGAATGRNTGRKSRSRVRWLMVIMAFLGISINYIDRANLGVAVPYI